MANGSGAWKLNRYINIGSFLLQVCILLSLPKYSFTSSNSGGSYKWKDLTQGELSKWYTPADLCVLNSSSRTAFPQDVRSRDCKQYSRGSRRMFCGVGMGNNNYPCYGPYADARPSFKRGLVGYTDASLKPLIQTCYQLIHANAALALLGDSTMRQKLQAFQCELQREDPRIRFAGNIFGIVPCESTMTIHFPDGKVLNVYGISLGPRAAACLKDKTLEKSAEGVYLHADQFLKRLAYEKNQSLVVVSNMGLWYNDDVQFRQVIPMILQWLLSVKDMQRSSADTAAALAGSQASSAVLPTIEDSKCPHQVIIAWHETLRQHWINPEATGYFAKPWVNWQESIWYTESHIQNVSNAEYLVPHCCQHISNFSQHSDWRNELVQEAIKHLAVGGSSSGQGQGGQQPAIQILPMEEITRDVPDMHTCNPKFKHDCTHYCYWPLLWQPFWHQLKDLTSQLKPIAAAV